MLLLKRYFYQNGIEFHHNLIGPIMNLPFATQSSEINEQSYLWSRTLAESVTLRRVSAPDAECAYFNIKQLGGE